MIHTTSYYVKCEGISLSDGTVFGADTHEMIRVVSEYGQPGFLVYEVIGKDILNIFGSGVRVDWKKMKEAIDERIRYQISIGNKVFCSGDEITEV